MLRTNSAKLWVLLALIVVVMDAVAAARQAPVAVFVSQMSVSPLNQGAVAGAAVISAAAPRFDVATT